jgi:hypothetical protein
MKTFADGVFVICMAILAFWALAIFSILFTVTGRH